MQDAQTERQRDARYPISRWYVRPLAAWAARWMSPTRIRPSHLTAWGAVMAAAAVVMLCAAPEYVPLAAIPVWLAWFYDRADGMLARRQGTTSAWGAWFDANIDELTDLALQVGVTIALVQQLDGASWPWFWLVAFLGGKYLLMYDLAFEELEAGPDVVAARGQAPPRTETQAPPRTEMQAPPRTETQAPPRTFREVLRSLYHLPGNCDVRVHWLIAMLVLDQLALELVAVALYYNLRWIVRYAIVWRRMGRRS